MLRLITANKAAELERTAAKLNSTHDSLSLSWTAYGDIRLIELNCSGSIQLFIRPTAILCFTAVISF